MRWAEAEPPPTALGRKGCSRQFKCGKSVVCIPRLQQVFSETSGILPMKDRHKVQKLRERMLEVIRSRLDESRLSRREVERHLQKQPGWLNDRRRYGLEIEDFSKLMGFLGFHPVEFLQEVLGDNPGRRWSRSHPIQTQAAEIWHRGSVSGAGSEWLTQAEELRHTEPENALRMIAGRIQELSSDQLPFALGCAGSALKGTHQFTEAESSIRQGLDYAFELGDLRGQAGLIQRLSHIYSAQGFFLKAIRENTKSLELYLSVLDMNGVGRALVDRGNFHLQARNFSLASLIFKRSLILLSPTEERNRVAAQHGFARCSTMMGDYDEALALALSARDFSQDPVSRIKLDWLIGVVYLRTERLADSIEKLETTCRAFLEMDAVLDLALASIDLWEAYARSENTDSARAVAQRTRLLLEKEAPWLDNAIALIARIGAAGQGISDSLLGRVRERLEDHSSTATDRLVELLQGDSLKLKIVRSINKFLLKQGTQVGDLERTIGKPKGWLAAREQNPLKTAELIETLRAARISPIDFFYEVFGAAWRRQSTIENPFIKRVDAMFLPGNQATCEKVQRRLIELDEARHDDPKSASEEVESMIDIVPSGLIPFALGVIGSSYRLRDDPATAEMFLSKSLELALHLDDPQAIGQAHQRISYLHYDQRRTTMALESNSQALEMALISGRKCSLLGKTLVDRAVFRTAEGEDLKANRLYSAARALLEGRGERRNTLAALQGQVYTFSRLKDYSKALVAAMDAMKLDGVDRSTSAKLRWQVGVLYRRMREYPKALEVITGCPELLFQFSPTDAVLAQIELCRVHLERGSKKEAWQLAEKAEAFAEPLRRVCPAVFVAATYFAGLGRTERLTLPTLLEALERVRDAASKRY